MTTITPRGLERQLTTRTGISAIGGIAFACLIWSGLPLGSTAAQTPPPVPALAAGPVGISAADRIVLMATNTRDVAIDVKMDIRDAADFSTVLVTTRLRLPPGRGATLPYSERTDPSRSVIGVVLAASDGNDWLARVPGVLATLSKVDDTTNTTTFVVAASVTPVQFQ